MHKKTKFRLPSTKKDMNTGSSLPNSPSPTDTSSSKWYHSINELPLYKFEECAITHNLSALIISGFPTPEELSLAWEQINIQYADAMGNAEHKLYISLMKEVALAEITLKQIDVLCELLTLCASESLFPLDLFKELNKLTKSTMPFTKNDPEGNIALIKRCWNRSRSIKINLDLKKSQLEALQAKHSTSEGVLSKEYFIAILITLSNHAGYQVHNTITVFEFCERLRRNNAHVEQLNKLYHGRK